MPENSTTSAAPKVRQANSNQSHLGLKAFIISTSVLGTMAGWGVLAGTQGTPAAQAKPTASTTEPAPSQETDSLRWVLPDVVAKNDVPRASASNAKNTLPAAPRANPAPPAVRDVKRNVSPNVQSNIQTNIQPNVPQVSQVPNVSSIREVNALPAPPVQPARRPKAVVRSSSSR